MKYMYKIYHNYDIIWQFVYPAADDTIAERLGEIYLKEYLRNAAMFNELDANKNTYTIEFMPLNEYLNSLESCGYAYGKLEELGS